MSSHIEREALRIASNSKVLDDVAERLIANIQQGMLAHNDTGNLSASWKSQRREKPDGTSDRYVYTDVSYAEAFEYGSRNPDGTFRGGANVLGEAIAKTVGGSS